MAGFNIHLSSRSIEKLEKQKQELESVNKHSRMIKTVPIDYSDSSQFDKLLQDHDVIDDLAIMVNNVGFLSNQSVFKMDLDTIEKHLKTNLYSYVIFSKHAKASFLA